MSEALSPSVRDRCPPEDHHVVRWYEVPQNSGASGSTGEGSYSQLSSHLWYPNPPAPVNTTNLCLPKPRGRMTAYAFFTQICREEHKKNHPEEHVAFAEFSKRCAERWKIMTDEEKKLFHDLAGKDKQRYEDEMKDYTPSGNVKRRGTKRQRRDPNLPKRPKTAYIQFSMAERSKVMEENPEYKTPEAAKELGRRWSQADPSVKSKYKELADLDKARYEMEMEEYRKIHFPSKRSSSEFTSEDKLKEAEKDEYAEDGGQ